MYDQILYDKGAGLKYIFSGELKDSATWVSENYYCSPVKITIIQKTNKY